MEMVGNDHGGQSMFVMDTRFEAYTEVTTTDESILDETFRVPCNEIDPPHTRKYIRVTSKEIIEEVASDNDYLTQKKRKQTNLVKIIETSDEAVVCLKLIFETENEIEETKFSMGFSAYSGFLKRLRSGVKIEKHMFGSSTQYTTSTSTTQLQIEETATIFEDEDKNLGNKTKSMVGNLLRGGAQIAQKSGGFTN